MEILMCAAVVIMAVFAFVSGVWTGAHFYCPKAEVMEPVVPRGVVRGKDDRMKDEVKETVTEADEERQRRFEEDRKAFEECMNYSLEKAYGGNTDHE